MDVRGVNFGSGLSGFVRTTQNINLHPSPSNCHTLCTMPCHSNGPDHANANRDRIPPRCTPV
ncbi:uncharacterized protein LOC62_06G008548 [Vanrija pseudolonga]|uniref:Uncharacterized protein n=1 Tax=Vanrija pseudolonga TaxID=143232 RepID=A0AAF0YJA8_9TREE|nr:hypothetical protein LOC62_06G008548 [Vanrija pseudolonga]